MIEYFEIAQIHLNLLTKNYLFKEAEFDINAEENKEVKDSLDILMDGTICGVEKSKVMKWLNDDEVKRIRFGYLPAPKTFQLNNQEDLYRFLAINIPLEEY